MKTLVELQTIRDEIKRRVANRAIVGDNDDFITVRMGECGIAAGARAVLGAINDELYANSLNSVRLVQKDCEGACPLEPMVAVRLGGVVTNYSKVTPELAKRIVLEHVMGGAVVRECVCMD